MTLLTTGSPEADEDVTAGQPVLPRVNLLPPELAERARLQRLQLGLGGGVLAVAGVMTVIYLGAASGVSEAQAELDAASSAGTALRAESAEFSGVLDVYAQAETARAMLTTAMGQEVRYSAFLDRLSRSVPAGVWLKTVEFTQTAPAAADGAAPGTGVGTVTFTGTAFRHDDVAVWLESLAEQEGYADPTFTDSTAGVIGKRPVVTFTSTVQITSAALSQRWTTGAGG